MPMTLRYEIFPLTPASSTATVKFYTSVLRFKLLGTKDNGGYNYVSRDGVRIGIVCPEITSYHKETVPAGTDAVTGTPVPAPPDVQANSHRLPPIGVETVYEVDDLDGEWETISAMRADKEVGEKVLGWQVMEDIKLREWGLKDFRIKDPVGYYIRVTNRSDEMGEGHET